MSFRRNSILIAGLLLFLLPFLRDDSRPSERTDVGAMEECLSNVSWNQTTDQREAGREAILRKRDALAESGPKRFDQPDVAAEFFLQQRLANGETELPYEFMKAQLEGIETREESHDPEGRSLPGGVSSWQAIGPGNIGGRTRAIVVDPVETDVMYAAGVAGGVFKSYDAGASWNATDDLMLNLAVCTLVMDPTDRSTLYAGTGEGFGSGSPFVRGLGIFKTTDAGSTWNQLSGTVSGVPTGSFYYVNKIVISPNDPNRIYAGTRFGVWRSDDGGESWSIVLSNPWYIGTPPTTNGCSLGCTDLAIRGDSDPDVLFAAFGSSTSDGLYRSDDAGQNWTYYDMGSNQGRMTIAIAPTDNSIVYVAMADNGSLYGYGRMAGIFRADDGINFAPILDWDHEFSPWLFSYVSIATGCYDHPVVYSQGWYDNIIAVDPSDPDVVWVGGINLFRSDDGGQTFGLSGYWFYYLQDPQPPVYIHPDQHVITFHPDYDGVTNQTMYVGNDGGLFRTLNAGAATSQEECPIGDNPGPPPEIAWTHINNGYGVTQYYHGDAAHEIDMFVGGAQDNGTSQGWSRYTPNDWRMVYGGDGGYVAINPTNSNDLFIEIQGFPTIMRSLNGGDSFFPAVGGISDTDGLFITPFVMDPSDPSILWTGGRRPWRTMNSGSSWTLAGSDFQYANNISAIAVSPTDGNFVYLGFNNGYVARTTTGLSGSPTWSLFSNGLQGGWVSSVAVDPQDPDVAYCTYSTFGVQHVLRTTNGGGSWISIDGIAETGIPDVPVHWIAVRPTDSQQLYVGTEFGVFASDDAGANWSPVNEGLAHTIVETLDFKDDDTLVAFTHGRGVFVADLLSPADATLPGDETVSAQLTLLAGPNPSETRVTLSAWIPNAGHVCLTIHDLEGRRIATLLDGEQEAGELQQVWNCRSQTGNVVAAGTYFARLEIEGSVVTQRVVLSR